MTTKEVAGICGVTSRTVSGNAKKAGIILEDGKTHNWTEDEVRKLQLVLMNNIQNRGNATTLGNVVENTARDALQGGMTLMEIIRSGNIEAMKELMDLSMTAVQETARNKQLEAEKKALEEKRKQLMLDYQNEKKEHQKDKELVLHKYLTATQIKDAIWKEYGKRIIVSKVIKRIPIDDNDILYKPFMNGNYTGQQPVHHLNVLDKIREIME